MRYTRYEIRFAYVTDSTKSKRLKAKRKKTAFGEQAVEILSLVLGLEAAAFRLPDLKLTSNEYLTNEL